MGARNTAIYSLMLDTGLRLTELVTLKYRDVHLDKTVHQGTRERGIRSASSPLEPTGRERSPTTPTTTALRTEGQVRDAFFLCIDGRCMTPDALRSLTERLSKAAGIPRLHPHLMRHTYATRFLLNGGNVFLLQQSLGHTTLTMVQKYVHIANRLAAQVSQDFSPLDRLEMAATKRFRHGFKGDNWAGRIYPNAARSQGRGVSAGNPFKRR